MCKLIAVPAVRGVFLYAGAALRLVGGGFSYYNNRGINRGFERKEERGEGSHADQPAF